jgi:hypothetical protein
MCLRPGHSPTASMLITPIVVASSQGNWAQGCESPYKYGVIILTPPLPPMLSLSIIYAENFPDHLVSIPYDIPRVIRNKINTIYNGVNQSVYEQKVIYLAIYEYPGHLLSCNILRSGVIHYSIYVLYKEFHHIRTLG